MYLIFRPVAGSAAISVAYLVSEEAFNFDSNLSKIYDEDPEKYSAVTVYEDASYPSGKYIQSSDIRLPYYGEYYARISSPDVDIDAPLYWGDTDEVLFYGAGQSQASFLPGFGRLIVTCAHASSYYWALEYIQPGDTVFIDTNYCLYEYQVSDVQIIDENDLNDIFREKINEGTEELILYTCYPFHEITARKTDRLAVFAQRVSGIDVKRGE